MPVTPETYAALEAAVKRMKDEGKWTDTLEQEYRLTKNHILNKNPDIYIAETMRGTAFEGTPVEMMSEQEAAPLRELAKADPLGLGLSSKAPELAALLNEQARIKAQLETNLPEIRRDLDEIGLTLQGKGTQEPLTDIPVLREIGQGLASAGLSQQAVIARALGDQQAADFYTNVASGAREAGGDSFLSQTAVGTVDSIAKAAQAGMTGPVGTIGWFTLLAMNEAAARGREAGLSGPELGRYVIGQGAIEGITSAVFQKLGLGGLERSLREPVRQGIARGLGHFAGEITEELGIEIMNRVHDYLSGLSDTAVPSADEIAQVVATTVLTMGLTEGGRRLGGTQTETIDPTAVRSAEVVDLPALPPDPPQAVPPATPLEQQFIGQTGVSEPRTALEQQLVGQQAVDMTREEQDRFFSLTSEPRTLLEERFVTPRQPVRELTEGERAAREGRQRDPQATEPATPEERVLTGQLPERVKSGRELARMFAALEGDPSARGVEGRKAFRIFYEGEIKNLQNPSDFVLADVPIAMLKTNRPGRQGRIDALVGRDPATAPPGLAGIYKDRNAGFLTVIDGNTRVHAAAQRGDATVRMYVPRKDLEMLGLQKPQPTAKQQQQAAEEARVRRMKQTLVPEDEREQLRRQLEQEKIARRTDELTGVPNLVAYREDTNRIFKEADAAGEPIAIAESDLGNFKVVNDELGHEVGDQLLKAEAEAIREALRMPPQAKARPSDYAGNIGYRIGGDEFPAILRNVKDKATAHKILKRASDLFDKKAREIIGDRLPAEAYPFIAWGVEIRKPGDTRTVSELRHAAEQQVIPEKDKLKARRGIPKTRDELTRYIAERKTLDGMQRDGQKNGRANRRIQAIMGEYLMRTGRKVGDSPRPLQGINTSRARRLAKAYDALEHNPNDPQVKASYEAFKHETLEQWNLLKEKGYRFEPWDGEGQPYKNVDEMLADIRDNRHLYFFTDPGDMPADHPMRETAPGTGGLTYNDVFRAVHDFFGHAKEGYGFDILGEENAWRSHSQMYSSLARGAMTTETRGQATWVGYGPYGEANRRAVARDDVPAIKFPPQKAALLPREWWTDTGLDPIETDTAGVADTQKQSRTGRQIQKAVEKLPVEKFTGMADTLADWLTSRGTYKRPEEWIARRRRAKGEDVIARERAVNWSNRFGLALKRAGYDTTDRDLMTRLHQTLQGKQDISQWPAEIRDLLVEFRQLQDQASREYAAALEAVGMTERARVVRENLGTYTKSVPEWTLTTRKRVARAVKNFRDTLQHTTSLKKFRRDAWTVIDTKGRVQAKFDKQGDAEEYLRAQQQKGWKVVPPRTEAERLAEDVQDPRYLLIAGLGETIHDAQIVQLHKWVADNLAVERPKGMTDSQFAEWAEQNDLVKLPHFGRFHTLQNKYVPKHVAEDLMELADIPEGLRYVLQEAVRVWKKGVIVYNPATHGRNLLGNMFFFSTLARTNIVNPANWKHYARGIQALHDKDAMWEEMARNDVIDGDLYSAEIRKVMKGITNPADLNPGWIIGRLLRAADNNMTKLYGLEDTVFKAAAYAKYRSQGMSPEEAGAEVNKWFPNYNRTAKLTQWLAKNPFGAPFASFLDQALRITGRAAKERPLALVTMFAIPGLLNFLGKLMAGATEEEMKLLRSGQGFMEAYFTPVLPWRDSQGRLLTFDLRYTIPLANDLLPIVREHGAVYLPWFANGPLATTFVEQISGRTLFTGKEFEGITDRLRAVGNNLIPLPSLIKHGPNRLSKGLKGEEDFVYSLLGTVAGLNARHPYVAEKHVLEAAARAYADGDRALAARIVRLWNRKFKPEYLRNLSMRRVETRSREIADPELAARIKQRKGEER